MNMFEMPFMFMKQLVRRIPRRILILIICLIFILIIFNLFTNSIENDEEWYKHANVYFNEVDCNHDDFTMGLYDELTQKLNSALKKLGLTYFLCYGSLWGALRMKKTLPWDRNIDFCILNHELATIDESTFSNVFESYGLKYKYNSRLGKYIVYYKTVTADITIFERVGSHMERIGWQKRLLPHLYLNYQNFPYLLIHNRPLPTVQFNKIEVPVPYDEYEIQKYFYPDNWWRIVKPKGCME